MLATLSTTLLKPFLRDRFLHVLLLLGLVLTLFQPEKIHQFAQFVDWSTIVTLIGLLMLTKGVEVSGYFDFVGRKMMNSINNERYLALFLVCAAALLSTFMTNDVALFIVIPLTITLKKLSTLPVTRLIIFEALAVNAGSLLTPIGNPQNILLWNKSGMTFMGFIAQMSPLALVSFVALLIVTWVSFPATKLKRLENNQGYPYQKKLLFSCLVMYVVFIGCVDFGLGALWPDCRAAVLLATGPAGAIAHRLAADSGVYRHVYRRAADCRSRRGTRCGEPDCSFESGGRVCPWHRAVAGDKQRASHDFDDQLRATQCLAGLRR
ncbi:Na+/H+ antiporter NhaD/arsenite permease-like protein [Ewingella americana]